MTSKSLGFQLDIKRIQDRQFEGLGAVFNNVDLGGDVIVPGAFADSLKQYKKDGEMPLMFWMHRPDQVPGRWVDMKETDEGLYVKGELVDTPLGNEIRTLLMTKSVRGLSIGYRPLDYVYDKEGNRVLKEIELWEVSVVSLAMNPLAQVEGAKSRLSMTGEYVPSMREFEHTLRDVGLSQSCVKRIISAMKAQDGLDDAGTRDVDPATRDVDVEEAAALLKSLDAYTDKTYAASLKR